MPILPKTAQEVQQLLDDPKIDLGRIGKLCERDPLLVCHVLKTANSALHRRSGKMESLQKALNHLGMRNMKNLLLTAISRQVFVSHEPRINASMQAMVEHCQAVALLARNVAGISGCRDSEPAYIAGLLHDTGKLVVAAYLLEFERSLPTREAMDWIDHDTWMNICHDLNKTVGPAFISGWSLPILICKVITENEDYDASDRISPVNSVLFANAIAKREGLYEAYADHDAVSSMVMIGKSLLGLDDAVISGLTREINDHVFT